MKKSLTITIILFFPFIWLFSQNIDTFNLDDVTTLSVESNWAGIKIFDDHSNFSLKREEIRKVLNSIDDKTALNTFNKGMASITGCYIFSFIGGFGIGYGLTAIIMNAVKGQNIHYSNYIILGIGAVALIPGITLEINGKKKIKHAIELYNSYLTPKNVSENRATLNFGVTNNGLGLILTF